MYLLIILENLFNHFAYLIDDDPVKISQENNISVMMYGENGEVEYGGDMKFANSYKTDILIRDRHYFSSNLYSKVLE